MIFTLNFQEFLHTMYKCVLNSVVKISRMSAQYFEYHNRFMALLLGLPG